ncbi:tRNA-dihydrouridine synthase [Phytophthora nicotianae]|uniref:tRNA-dihydrouridine synthase n=1 Tax=Phytophthora nicotianae TaxID=4792 RepID=A0A0W8DRR0_PHYNI|nr:tRNA-dihydrouridine synthase [Phytophthora nicotianae]
MELTLQQLKEIRSQQDHSGSTRDSQCEEEDASGIPAVWQDICTRQLNRRLKAEQENAKLKKRWEEEKRVVKSIENMLFKRMALTGKAHPGASKHTRRTNLPAEYIKRVAAFIFDELSASVEVSYREVEEIIAGDGPVPKNVVTHQPLLRGGMKGMYRRLFDKRVVPFTLSETGDAWWKHWHSYRGQKMPDPTTNVVTESFGLEMTDLKTNASATSYGQQILRRHVEENRIVFVWNAYIEPFVFENQPVSGVYLLEQSHVLIKPVDPDSNSEDDKKHECFTSISTCYVITPHFLDPELKNDPNTTTLLDFLVSIEICYLLNESVLGANTTVPTSMASRMPLLRGGLKGEERTLFDRRILPFSMHNISEAWWRDWHNYKGHKETPGDVVVESFGLEMSDFKTNTSVLSYGQQILRRDIEDDQIVFVWNAYLEPFIYDNEQVGGIYFLEQCHMIIKPEAEDTTTNEDELASCMSSCYVITPYFLDSTLEKDPRAAALVDFLVGALFFHMKAQNDTVEDLLLEQALQSRTCTNK